MLTAENQEEADKAKIEWGLSDDMTMIGDPSNEIALYMKQTLVPGLEFAGE